MEEIGERLKRLRKKRKLSTNQMAKMIGVSSSTYRMWERGSQITGEPYVRIAHILEVSLVELLTGLPNDLNRHLVEIEKLIKQIRMEL